MANLLERPARKITAAENDARSQARRGWDAWFRGLSSMTGAVPTSRSENMLAGAYPKVPASAPTKKCDPADVAIAAAPAHVQALAARHGREAGHLLAIVAKRSAETRNEPVKFGPSDAAEALGITKERAEGIMRALLQAGVLLPRTDSLGGPAGYAIARGLA